MRVALSRQRSATTSTGSTKPGRSAMLFATPTSTNSSSTSATGRPSTSATTGRELANNPLYAHFIANRSGPVLDKWPHYFPIYARHLDRFRGRPVRVLEIGVYRGGGLELWQRYLGPTRSWSGSISTRRPSARLAAGSRWCSAIRTTPRCCGELDERVRAVRHRDRRRRPHHAPADRHRSRRCSRC